MVKGFFYKQISMAIILIKTYWSLNGANAFFFIFDYYSTWSSIERLVTAGGALCQVLAAVETEAWGQVNGGTFCNCKSLWMDLDLAKVAKGIVDYHALLFANWFGALCWIEKEISWCLNAMSIGEGK